MAVLHITESELVSNIANVMEQVRRGSEIVVERENHPVAVIKPSHQAGRLISAVLADLNARGSSAVMDEAFAGDVEEGIKAREQAWNPPSSGF